MPFGWGADPNEAARLRGEIITAASPMPFGWGANPNTPKTADKSRASVSLSPMPFGWGANPNALRHGDSRCPDGSRHQCLSDGGLIQTEAAGVKICQHGGESPMPFGWGANPNPPPSLICLQPRTSVTNAFRLGG